MDEMDAHQGKKILVHCALNYRVSTFTALWRIHRLGWRPENAFEPLKKVWEPEEFPAWKAFIEQMITEKL
jgi:hypothetical protein